MTTLTAIITALGLLFLFVIGILLGKAINQDSIKYIVNKNRKFGSSGNYFLIKGRYSGKKIDLLLTESDFSEAKVRASKNLEDLK